MSLSTHTQQKQRPHFYLLSFPDELLLHILCHLSLRDLQKCSQTCKHLQSLLSAEDDLSWRCLFIHRFELERNDSIADMKALLHNLSTQEDLKKKRWKAEYFARLVTNEKWISSRVIVRLPKEPHSAASNAGLNSMDCLLDFSSKHILIGTRAKRFCRLILDPFDGLFPIIDVKPFSNPPDNLSMTCFTKASGSKILMGFSNGVVAQCDWRCSNEFPLSYKMHDDLPITHIVYHKNDVIAVGANRIVRRWNLKSKTAIAKELEHQPEYCGDIICLEIRDEHDIVAATDLGYLLVWSIVNDQDSLTVHPGFSPFLTSANPLIKALIRGNKFIGLAKDRTVRVWNTSSAACPSSLSMILMSSHGLEDSVMIEANTQWLVLSKNDEYHFWKLLDVPKKGGICFERYKSFTCSAMTKVTSIFADKCLLGVASSDGRLQIFDGLKAELIRSIEVSAPFDDSEVVQISFDWKKTKAIVITASQRDGNVKMKFLDFLIPPAKTKTTPSPSKAKDFINSRKLNRRGSGFVDDYQFYLEQAEDETRRRKRLEQRYDALQMSYQEQLDYVTQLSQLEASSSSITDMTEEEQLQYALMISQQSETVSVS